MGLFAIFGDALQFEMKLKRILFFTTASIEIVSFVFSGREFAQSTWKSRLAALMVGRGERRRRVDEQLMLGLGGGGRRGCWVQCDERFRVLGMRVESRSA